MNTTRAVENGVGIVTVNRPDVRNALNRETADEIRAALAEFGSRKDVGCVIVTGAGDKVFVSGADLRELQKKGKHDALDSVLSALFSEIEAFPKPVIAAVNGFALGGGCELSLACDLRAASENAKFGFPETGLGIIPGAGGTQRLPKIVGLGRAKELVLTGDIIDAKRALEIGLVNVVAPNALEAAKALAAKILTRAPIATRLAKAALNLGGGAAGLQYEIAAQALLFETKDKLEGTTAFLEKRKANFTGE